MQIPADARAGCKHIDVHGVDCLPFSPHPHPGLQRPRLHFFARPELRLRLASLSLIIGITTKIRDNTHD